MRHTVLRDGVIAGVLGGTCVAVWFFIVDLIVGRPLATPLMLGGGLVSIIGVTHGNPVLVILAYTAFHYIAFAVVGLIAALIVHRSEQTPSLLAGAFLFFVAAEMGFYLMSFVLAQSPAFGPLSGVQVAVGNFIAAVAMGTYFWRTHPALKSGLDQALSGRQ
jgi:hypothetical protein